MNDVRRVGEGAKCQGPVTERPGQGQRRLNVRLPCLQTYLHFVRLQQQPQHPEWAGKEKRKRGKTRRWANFGGVDNFGVLKLESLTEADGRILRIHPICI